ncbi:hypothetical protein EON77_02480 [bacterium]|nr:MAG: hypothetical protein EON77_02480 [bacterium]
MILAPTVFQNEATTREAALHVAWAFIRSAGLSAPDLGGEIVQAEAGGYVPGSFQRGEAVWRLVSRTQGLTLIVPYRAAFVARYDDTRSFFRPRRAEWSRDFPTDKARRLTERTFLRLGIPRSWINVGDTFLAPGKGRAAQWPLMAMMTRAERPSGFPVIGAANEARLQLETSTGALRWFAQCRDRRFAPIPKPTARAPIPGRPKGGTRDLVWDARDPDRPARLAYRLVEPGRPPRYVDAETGRPR